MEEADVPPLIEAIRGREPLAVVRSIVVRWPQSLREEFEGMFPLSFAVLEGSPLDVVEFLCHAWPDAVKTWDLSDEFAEGGRLPLHYVSDATPVEAIQFLVDMYPEALEAPDEDNAYLPIHTSIERNVSRDVVQMLVERCPRSLSKRGCLDFYSTPLDFAVKAVIKTEDPKQLDVLRYLAEQSPRDLVEIAVDSEDTMIDWDESAIYSSLPIHLAAETCGPQQLEVIRFLAELHPETLLVATGPAEYGDQGPCFDGNELPIHCAARTRGPQQLSVIQFLADLHPETLLARTSRGKLPLHHALRSNVSPGVIQLLVDLMPESVPEEARLDLMFFTVRYVDFDDAEFLVENVGALAEALPQSLHAKDSHGALPVHVAVGLRPRRAVTLRILQRLVELYPGSLLVPNADGDLPLHIAIRQKPLELAIVEFLLVTCPRSALIPNGDGNLAIHIAIDHCEFHFVRSLVRLAPEASRRVGAAGRTPLHGAVAVVANLTFGTTIRHVLDIMSVLIDCWEGSLLELDANGDLPLHVAISRAMNRGREIVMNLLDRCPPTVKMACADRKLPLHVAVSKDRPSLPIVQLLLERWPGSLQVRDAAGNLPLFLAAQNGTARLDLIYYLVKASPVRVFRGYV